MAKAREGDGIQLPPAVSLGLISTPLERETETELLELSRDPVRLIRRAAAWGPSSSRTHHSSPPHLVPYYTESMQSHCLQD